MLSVNINKDFNNEFSSIQLLFIERQITTVPSKRLILEGKDPSEKIQQSTITDEEALGSDWKGKTTSSRGWGWGEEEKEWDKMQTMGKRRKEIMTCQHLNT